jgi:hypothetical protein
VDLGRLVKWIVIAAIVVFAWKVGLPWMQQQRIGSSGPSISSAAATVDDSCVGAAERASETWGSGLPRFINPPYDMDAWSSFRASVNSHIGEAESKCTCAEASCETVRGAMRDLRELVSDMDGAIRSGSSPGNIVQRQESIDNRIAEARDSLRGK